MRMCVYTKARNIFKPPKEENKTFYFVTHKGNNKYLLLLLPLALQPTVGFGLSNNVLPFFTHLPPTLCIFSLPAIEDLFLLPLSIFSWVFPLFSSLPVLEWRSFWASYPPPFTVGDLTSLAFALLSILLYNMYHLLQYEATLYFPRIFIVLRINGNQDPEQH